jgi:hypothetical protein
MFVIIISIRLSSNVTSRPSNVSNNNLIIMVSSSSGGGSCRDRGWSRRGA